MQRYALMIYTVNRDDIQCGALMIYTHSCGDIQRQGVDYTVGAIHESPATVETHPTKRVIRE